MYHVPIIIVYELPIPVVQRFQGFQIQIIVHYVHIRLISDFLLFVWNFSYIWDMTNYQKLEPPPKHLKCGDLAVIPNTLIKEFIVEITRSEESVIIKLLNSDLIRWEHSTQTYWISQATETKSSRIKTTIRREYPIENVWFFTRMTKELERDITISEILEHDSQKGI